jgi:nitroimidazol reductase NimA-like FMN-containing flavoprotein (pyridoxamine 5'-phosphate oxidase superfamily)
VRRYLMEEFIESREEMEQLLTEMTLGCLGLVHEGRPYVIPINYAYIDGRVLFHCALEGQKLDAIRSDPSVCFTVARQRGTVKRHSADVCHPDSESVVCYGRARIVEDLAERTEVLNEFNRSFRPDAESISAADVAKCGAVEITVTEMTGRRELARSVTCWRYRYA